MLLSPVHSRLSGHSLEADFKKLKKMETVMFEKNKLLRALLAAGLTTGLVACGGGSSGDGATDKIQDPETEQNDSSSPAPGENNVATAGSETGRFVDSAVGGIEYETSAGYASTTNDNGEFKFNKGETVTFRLGQLNFGTVEAGSLITPVELASGDSNKAANIARVLQTLDDDGNPDNGITITPTVREKAKNQNPTDVATADLTAVKEAILSLASENTYAPADLVTQEQAESHLNETIAAEKPVTSCGDDATPVTADHLIGKTYGYTRLQENDKEINLMQFSSAGGLTEFQNDLGVSRVKTGSTWSVSNGEITFADSTEAETFTACAVGPADSPYYLIFDSTDGAVTLYSVKPFTAPTASQSYLLTSIDTNLVETQHDIVTIDSEMNAEFLSEESFAETQIASDGSLTVSDNDGSNDSLYLLAAQGKRKGIYLDFDVDGNLEEVGMAESIPTVAGANEATFSGNTFVYRNESENETVVLTYNTDGTFEDFNNDCYDGDQQNACYYTGNWRWVTEFNLLEEVYSEDDSAALYVAESRNTLSILGPNDLGEYELFNVQKTQAISKSAFAGTYTIDIPTENTRLNKLVINDGGSCTYSDTACSWVVDESGKAVISFAADSDTKGNIWQLAGSTSTFAFVMTHADANDIEPGLMTRD